jgi:hypothetical protein
VTAAGELTSLEGFTAAAASYDVPNASLWACLIRDVATQEAALEPPRALVSTRRFTDGFSVLHAFRPRWHIEDDTYRELKEGWGLEKQRWGRDFESRAGAHDFDLLGLQYGASLSLAGGRAAGFGGHSSAAATSSARAG